MFVLGRKPGEYVVIEQTIDGVALSDMEGNIRFVNQAWADMHGFRVEELIGKHLGIFHTQDQLENEVGPFNEILLRTGANEGEVNHVHKDGTVFPTWMTTTMIRGGQGQPLGLLGICRDITERRRMERERHRLASEYETVFQSTQDAMFLVKVLDNETFRFIRNNDAHAKTTHLDSKSFSGKTPEEVVGEELATTINANYRICVQQRQPLSYEETLALPGGTRTWSTLLTPVIEEGRVTHIVGFSRDITDRVEMENALREGEKQLKEYKDRLDMILENITDNVWSYDMDQEGNLLSSYISPAGAKQLGIGEDELNHSFDVWFSHVLPEDLQVVLEAMEEAIRDGHGRFVEYRIQRADRSIRWIRSKGDPVHTPDGGLRLVGVGQDITERKQMEEALRESEEKFRTLFERCPDGVFILSTDGIIIDCNKRAASMNGYTKAELVGCPIATLNSEVTTDVVQYELKDKSLEIETYIRTLREQDSLLLQINHRRKDNTTVPIEASVSLVTIGGREYTIGFDRDVSERHKVEDELQKQTGLIQSLLDSIPDIIFYKDVEGVYLGCNPAFAEHVGLTADKIVGRTDYQLYSKEEADEFRRNDQRMLALGRPRHNEEWITYPDGRSILIDTLKTPYVGPEGQLIGILGISRDITERKKAEESLRKAVTNINALLETSPTLISIVDKDGRYVEVSAATARVIGLPPEDIKGRTFSEVLPPTLALEFMQTVDDLREKQHGIIKTDIIQINGHDRIFETFLFPIDQNGTDIELIGSIALDITERKQAEDKLSEYTMELESLYRFLDDEMQNAMRVYQRLVQQRLPQIEGMSVAAVHSPATFIGGDFSYVIQKHSCNP